MASPTLHDPCPRPGRRMSRWVAGVALACASALVPVPLLPAAPASAATSDITVAQANLLSPQSDLKFRRDVNEVLGYRPDLVTYNEVAWRRDEVLAPAGYDLWREDGRYQRTVPVAWRTDKWTPIAKGSYRISNWRSRLPDREVRLGIRWANWVALKSPEGRVLTLVSVHFAPKVRGMPDLRQRSAERLSTLVQDLKRRGPVLVGGDFNIHYRSSIYPATAFDAAKMKTTYELLGTKFSTGDHGGATIDWVVVRGSNQLEVDRHFKTELNSDHDAVFAKLSWTTDAPSTTTTVRNDPDGDRAARWKVVSAVRDRIAAARSGQQLELATRGLNLRPVRGALAAAFERGVDVRLTTRSPSLTTAERGLRELFDGSAGSWVRRCRNVCASDWEGAPTQMLVTGTTGLPRMAVDVSRRLRGSLVTQQSSARFKTGDQALAEAQAAFGS